MSTGFNTQYQYPQYQQPTASAVNIQIFNPTANPSPQAGQSSPLYIPAQQSMPYGTMPGIQTGYMSPNYQPVYQPMYQPAPPLYNSGNIYGQPGNSISYPMNYNAPINQTNYNTVNSDDKNINNKEKDNKTEKKKSKVILTDDYIKSLENFLNNQNSKVRLSAAKELLDRFKEDDKRKSDPALCALLNKVIQDPKASVRYIGLTTLDAGYAQGNNETVAILKQLQNRPDLEYGEDSALASQILLKMSGQKIEVPDNNPQNEGDKAA